MELSDNELLVFVKNFIQDNNIKIPLDDNKIIKEKQKITFIAGNWLLHDREAQYQLNHLRGYIEWKCKKKLRKTKTK